MDETLDSLRQKLSKVIADNQVDVDKAIAGQKAAGTRVHKTMQEVKKIAQEIRQKVLDVKNVKE